MKPGPLAHVRRELLRGLFLVLPLLITVWLLGILFDVLNENVTPYVRGVLEWTGIPGLERWFLRLGIPIIGLALTTLFIYLLGLFAGNLVGRRVVAMFEATIMRIPVIKGVYGGSRQLLDAFSMTGTRTFSRVVMVEYPRRGMWTLGFVTRDSEHRLPDARGRTVRAVPVFLPTTPNPTSGWMILAPSADVRVLNLTIEDGMKLIVSGALVSPRDLGEHIVGWSPEDEGAA